MSSVNGQSNNTPILLDNKVINPIKPTPEMATLGKYGSIPVDHSSGAMTFNLPLYSIKKDNVEIPLGISFASQGLRPTDIGNVLGVNWVLSGLASISREIKGLPDELAEGFLNNQVTDTYINSLSPLFTYSEGQNYLKNIFNISEDLNPDAFAVSLPGFSNKFFVNSNKQLEFALKTDYKIEITGPQFGFKVTDPSGNKYFFEATETSFLRSEVLFNKSPIIYSGITGWKVSKIITNKGKEINFQYENYYYSYRSAAQDVITIPNDPPSAQAALVGDENGGNRTPGLNISCGCQGETSYNYGHNLINHNSKILTKIITDEESIDFIYNPIDYSLSTFKISLKEIRISSTIDGVLLENFSFDYSHFSGDKRLKLVAVHETGQNATTTTNTRTHTFSYYEDYLMPATDSRSIDENGFYNGAINTHLVYRDRATAGFNNYADRLIRLEYMQTGMLKAVIYPTGGKSEFVYELNSVHGSTTNFFPGLRIKKVISTAVGNPANTTEYVYKNNAIGNITVEYPKSVEPNYLPNLISGWDCSKWVLTSDIHDIMNNNYLPMPKDFYYDEVEILQTNPNGSSLKTIKKFTAFETMLGDLQVRPSEEAVYKTSGSQSLLKQINYDYSFKGMADYSYSIPQYAVRPAFPVNQYNIYSYYTGQGYTLGCGEVFFPGLAKGLWRFQSVIRETKQTIKEYDGSGNVMQTSVIKNYGTQYENIASTVFVNSKQQTEVTSYVYPYNNTGIPVYQDMVTRNMISGPIEVKVENVTTGKIVSWNRHQYKYINGSIIGLDKQEVYNNQTNAFETVVTYNSYDNKANLLQLTPSSGSIISYLWNYGGTYPTAQVTNAPFSSIAYTSFEADGKGNWDYAGSINTSEGITGGKSYYLSTGNIERTALNAGTTYTITYWVKNGGCNIGGTALMSKNGWTLYEATVSGISTLTISGYGLIDELRLYPKGAQMTTYTYTPLVGMSSQCDVNNRISYYEYDAMNRLKLIRDMDKNILKSFDYTYQQIQY
jgi:hypothetical protein